MGTQAINKELPSSFAGALAAFAAQHEDGLADDIAVLSYERAVSTQTSFNPVSTPASQDNSSNQPPPFDKKSASITIRMSHAECEQLRKRAAAANLSVSAYMRSCIIEAESLRAQVREALAELRAATPDESQSTSISAKQSPRRWWQLGALSN